ncbi:MAG: UDP-N-acetylmuramoyl-tripeptide--D-alanyl-D-alanine ligase, partial [Planctomycetes bacterium]|nr:UDP-N-acetylmuramoyl-tripeptide--D-alanyl-D-alanine ligase [Planctomycetota bacterium]
MSSFTLDEIRRATGAVLWHGRAEARVRGVSTDSRTLPRESLYVALRGANFDGNAFAADACASGAAALLLRAENGQAPRDLPDGVPVLLHADPQRALLALADFHRRRLKCPVIAITGSAGKTTTKNMLQALLEPSLRVVASEKSFNNDIGVPLTLLRADETTEVLIVEVGTNAPGEIAALAAVVRPSVSIVTGIGHAHLEKLGSLEGVAREKAALLAALPSDGLAVLNADCRQLPILRAALRSRVITCSVQGDADLVARELLFHGAGSSFRLGPLRVTLPLLGTHNVSNLLLAIAACQALGLGLDELLPRIACLQGGKQRLERHELAGITLIDDAYNANPESMRAAVRVLEGLHGYRRRVFVLGDMLELGPSSAELHHALGAEIASRSVDLLVLVGELARAAGAGALEAGLAPARV